MLYELILINEIEQRAKIIFLSVHFVWYIVNYIKFYKHKKHTEAFLPSTI